jgi:DNA-binding transcriptional regulator LsrR (DeoR family)
VQQLGAGSRERRGSSVGPDELFQRAVIARRYYLEGRTRIQIADEFGLSRFKVTRMLDEAIESGMVEIKIHNPGSIDVELSTALQKRYGLEHAYAVTGVDKIAATRAVLRSGLVSSLVTDTVIAAAVLN